MRTKAFRRHQLERKKAWATSAAREWYRAEPTAKQIGMLAHTPKACSCWMCGNQRQVEGATIQERKYK
mgnify:CR=1 FL=1|tara:strand:- start:2936 stop:3139 length:204 start_codon:yes stop_codon:yes gene_type:complete